MKPDISVNVWGKRFKNPIVVASATPTKNAEYIKKAVDSGAGGVVAKTVTREPALQKYVRPRFTVLHKRAWPHNFSNYSCEFLATYTPEEWAVELKEAKQYCEAHDVRLIGSLSGSTLEVWAELAKLVEETGVDMLELNFGCPHPRDLDYKSGAELGRDPEAAAEVTRVVVDSVSIPVIVKLTPEAVDPVLVAKMVKEAGASGVTAINRFPALDIDLPSGRPLLHSTFAGVGGPWMRPIMLKWVAKITRDVGIPVSATNGIWTWKDVVKAIMCGAYTVQTCTAIMYGQHGYDQVRLFLEGLEKFMVDNNYQNLEQMRGITLSKIKPWTLADRDSKAWSQVNVEQCNGCMFCLNWCFYDAISEISWNGKQRVAIDKSKCDGCGLCASLCPRNAITMEGEAEIYLGDFQ